MDALANVENPEKCLHFIVDELCGRDPSLIEFGSPAEILPLAQAVQAFLPSAVSLSSPDEVDAALQSHAAPSWDAHLRGVFVSVLQARRDEITRALQQHAATVSAARLKDFDWSLRLVLASDKVAAMREPRLVLNLELENADASARDVTLELSPEELDELIATCETVHQATGELQL